jgi:hypothetical protein
MTIPAWPAGLPIPNSCQFTPVANTQSGGVSPFDRSEQTLALPGTRWRASLHWSNLKPAEHRPLAAWLASLGGKAGRFTWSPPRGPLGRRATALANAGEVVRVRTAGQSGALLDTTGWDGASAPALAGDLLGWLNTAGRPQLHMVTADVAAVPPTSTNLQFYGTAPVAGISAGALGLGPNSLNGGAVADPAGGTAALRLGASSGSSNYLLSGRSASASTTYSVSLDARRATGSGTAGTMLFIDEIGSGSTLRTVGLSIASLSLTSTWQRVARSFTTRSDTTSINIGWAADITPGTQFDLFGLQLEQRASATPRIATPGAATATRTQSVSIAIAPPIRTAPNANEPLVLVDVPGVFGLAADEFPPEYLPGGACNLSIDIDERFFG